MKLLVKFNLVFGSLFAVALAAVGLILWTLLQNNVKEEIRFEARLLMEAAMSKRNYTSTQIAPLLDAKMQSVFTPQVIPAYGASELFAGLHKRYPEYTYKEAVLNPTNPRDRAVEWEADIIQRFRQDAPSTSELSGARSTAAGPFYYVARPIAVTEASCLNCHGTPEAAPKTLLARYGSAGGFGWQQGEVVGAQIISVPMSVAQARASSAFWAFMLSICGVFIALAIAMNVLLYGVVIRPLGELSSVVDRLSRGDMEAPEFRRAGRDEIAVLASSFTRLRRSLAQAFRMIED